MKTTALITIILLFAIFNSTKSQLYTSSSGTVSFTSDAPLEMIQAKSNELTGVVNASNKTFVFKVDMNSFEGFNSGMQKTHFKENYIETSKYQYATFEGRIIEDVGFDRPGTYEARGKGKFQVHGVENVRIIPAKLVVSDDQIIISADFSVFLAEHDIKIPSVVNQKIAEEVTVKMNIVLDAK